jgi:SagB-type dehydrogenase family enzyme
MAKKKNTKPNLPSYLGVWSLILIIVIALLTIFGIKNKFQPNPSAKTKPINSELTSTPKPGRFISLPSPRLTSKTSIETTLYRRRSRRNFLNQPLNLKQVSQMLWAAQGITTDWGGRTAPSAKSAYPLTLYLIANNVSGLENGLYRYLPGDKPNAHQLEVLKLANLQEKMAQAVGQASAKNPPALVVISGDFAKMAAAFNGKRLDNNVYLEAGHVAENMYLQAESLKLGMVVVGGFNHEKVAQVINSPDTETLIYTIPFGHPEP